MLPEKSEIRPCETARIADQLERAFEGDAWHGSSISEILADVTAAEAASRPFPGRHSIWEIVRHMTAWQREIRRRLEGAPVTSLPDEQDWPLAGPVSAPAWEETVRELRSEYELLRKATLAWGERDIDTTPEGDRFTVYQLLHGVLQHNLYHAGQIAILKRAADSRTAESSQ